MSCDVVLRYPDISKPYQLHTDASNFAIGAVLSQSDDRGRPHVVQYFSKVLDPTQQRWSTIEKEAYAIVASLASFRPYRYGASFVIRTDHKPLNSLFQQEQKNSNLQRWYLQISEYVHSCTVTLRRATVT